MSLSTPLTAVASAIVAGAAVFFTISNQNTEDPVTTTKIFADRIVNSELSSTSQMNYHNGVRSELFTIDTTPGQVILLTTKSELPTNLSVFDNGRLLACDKKDCSSAGQRDRHSRSNNETSLAFKASSSGPYLVAVSGRDANTYGPFQLTATVHEGYGGEQLSSEQRISDWALGTPLHYTLHIEQDGIYRIDMRAFNADLGPYLILQSNNGFGIADSYDYSSGTNTRLDLPLAAGRYTLIADSAGETSAHFHGKFDIQVTKLRTFGEIALIDGQPLRLNTQQNRIQYNDKPLRIPLVLTEPSIVTLNAVSSRGNKHIYLEGRDVYLDGSYEEGKLHAFLQPGQYEVRLPGDYVGELILIEAVSRPVPANIAGGELKIGEQHEGLLISYTRFNLYHFTVTQAGNYVIEMKPLTQKRPHLTLYRDDVQIAKSDEQYDYPNAGITLDLQPGEYKLYVSDMDTSYYHDRTYTLSVRPATQ